MFALSAVASRTAPGEDCTDLGLVDLPGFRTASLVEVIDTVLAGRC